jgi:hypothetical protein
MKITPTLFLDMDGVMLPGEWLAKRQAYHSLDPDCCMRLNDLLQEVKPELVISSTWRRFHTKPELEEHFRNYNINYPISDYTPVLDRKDPDSGIWKTVERGEEIAEWLRLNFKDRIVAILDDDADMGLLMPYLVQTEFMTGLQDKHCQRVKELLIAKKENEISTSTTTLTPVAPSGTEG